MLVFFVERQVLGRRKRFWYDEALDEVVVQDSPISSSSSSIDGEKEEEGLCRCGSYSGVAPVGARLVRFSLDGTALAAQVGESSVVVVETKGNQVWRLGKSSYFGGQEASAGRVQGLVWSDHGGSSQDLLVLNAKGVDFYKVATARGMCRHVRSLQYGLRTFWYEPTCRLLALGTGTSPPGCDIRAYWLRTHVSDMPKFELPPPEKIKKFRLPVADYVDADAVSFSDAAVCVLYSQAYFVFAHKREDLLLFYQFGKDKAVLAKSVKILSGAVGGPRTFSSATDLSLAADDDLLQVAITYAAGDDHYLIHQIYDIRATQPLVASSTAKKKRSSSSSSRADRLGDSGAAPLVYEDEKLLEPVVSLKFVAEQIGDDPRRLVSFLLRRQGREATNLVAAAGRELMVDHNLEDLSDLFDLVADAQSVAVDNADPTPPPPTTTTTSPSKFFLDASSRRRKSFSPGKKSTNTTTTRSRCLTQVDIVELILSNSRTEEVDLRTLADATTAYLASLHRRRVPIVPVLAERLATLLLELGETAELAQSVQFKILPDSEGLCDLLLEVPQLRRLGLDALHRLKLHARLVDQLLASGMLEEAARVSVAHRVPLYAAELTSQLPDDLKTPNRLAIFADQAPTAPLHPDTLAAIVLDHSLATNTPAALPDSPRPSDTNTVIVVPRDSSPAS